MKALLEFLAQRGTLLDAAAAKRLEALGSDLAPVEAALRAAPALPLFLTEAELSRLVRVAPVAPRDPPTVVVQAERVGGPPPAAAPAPPPAPPASIRPAPPAAPAHGPAREAAPPPAPASAHPAADVVGAATAGAALAAARPAVATAVEVRAVAPAVAEPALEPYQHEWSVLADVTGQSTCEGALTDFTRYFNDRLQKIKKMLRQRREMAGHVPIKSIRPGAMAEVKIVGIVNEVRTTKNGHRLLEVEDESGVCAVLAPASDAHRMSEAESVIEDEVVGIVAKPASKGDLLILEKIVRPEVPMERAPNRAPKRSAVAFVSDLHFGSKTFLSDDWERFLRWINGDGPDARSRALARKVRYLVVNGDLVDGVGIFPGQEDELAIVDAYEQYRFAAEQLARVRPEVQLICLPGNHDLVRPAEPQPAFPDKYAKLFAERIRFVGNPCKISLEGVEVLAYHGRSFDDWITRVAGLSYERPIDAMREMIARRHMVPIYGQRTPIAPEHKDYLVIDTVPDVYVTGHVHSAGLEQWRGITLINASCWQSQTAYQKMHGFQPVPGRVPVVELDTGRAHMLDFHEGSAGIDRVGRSALGTPDPRVTPEF